MKDKSIESLKVLAVCGGNGVICHPFKTQLVANIEPRAIFKTPGNVQWTSNFGKIPLFHTVDAFVREFGTKPDVDLLIGAPDCGHSSILSYSRSKSLHNPRDNASLTTYLNAVKTFQPTVFFMENLPAMLKTITRNELRSFFDEYRLSFICKSVTAWGNSQKNRIRLVVIGVKRDSDVSSKPFRNITPVAELKTAGELIEGLVLGESGHIREDINTRITLYAGKKMALTEIRDEWLKRGVSRWDVEGRRFFTAPGVYLNLKHKAPSTARKANRQFNHEGLMMSPRELARIQGVPDTFNIWIDKGRLGYCINKGRASITKCPTYEMGVWLKQAFNLAMVE